MYKRRNLLVAIGIGILVPSVGVAQKSAMPARIGILGAAPGPHWDTFKQELRRLGYEEGRNIEFELRWVEGRDERLATYAAELVNRNLSILVTEGTNAVVAARKATGKIPIVMAISGDPLGAGVVSSLARPGGNVTGSSSLAPDLISKQMELLKEVVPGMSRVAIMTNPEHPLVKQFLAQAESAARALRLQLAPISARGRADYFEAFQTAGKERAGAVLIAPHPTFDAEQTWLAEFAIKNKFVTLYNKPTFAEAGGMLVHGARYADFFTRAAVFVDRILKGAKPGDLPIEQPTKFELVINLKTAKGLGIKIPQSILVRADKVIE